MFNDKQMELSHMLFDKLKSKFPEIQLADITEAAYDPGHIWINVFMPDNEDREIALREMAAEARRDFARAAGGRAPPVTGSAGEWVGMEGKGPGGKRAPGGAALPP